MGFKLVFIMFCEIENNSIPVSTSNQRHLCLDDSAVQYVSASSQAKKS